MDANEINETATTTGEATEPEAPSADNITSIKEKPAMPVLNRAQRRALAKYIKHQARLQTRHVRKVKNASPRQAMCPRCYSPSFGMRLGGTVFRCQCQAQMKHRPSLEKEEDDE